MKAGTRSHWTAVIFIVLLCRTAATAEEESAPENFEILAKVHDDFIRTIVAAGDTILMAELGAILALDMSDPALPVVLSRMPLQSGKRTSWMLTNGTHLYIAVDGHGLQIYDYTDPQAPAFVQRFAPYDTYRPHTLTIDGDRLYFGGSGLRIFDLSNPGAPVEIANHPIPSDQLAADQGVVLVSGGIREPLHVYGLTDPTSPTFWGTLDYSHPETDEEPWHRGVTMTWPRLGVVNLWTDPVDRKQRCGINVYTPGGNNQWNRTEKVSPKSEFYPHAGETWIPVSNLDIVSDMVFVTYDGWHEDLVFQFEGLTQLGEIDFQTLARPAIAGERIYPYNGQRIESYDFSAPSTFTLLGDWDTLAGKLAVRKADRLYILGEMRNVTAVDVTNPTAARVSGRGPLIRNPTGAKISGDLLYVTDLETGLHVIDLADPDRPQRIGEAPSASGGRDVDVSGNRAFVAANRTLLRVYDISDPTSPVTLGVLEQYEGFQDSTVVRVSGEHAYVAVEASISDRSKLIVVNVRFPDNPWPVGMYDAVASDMAIAGDTLFVLNQPLHWGGAPPRPGPIYDISDPTALRKIGEFAEGESFCLQGDWAFVTDERELHAYSVADPTGVWEGGIVETGFRSVAAEGGIVYAVMEPLGDHLTGLYNRFWIMKFTEPEPVDIEAVDFGLTTAGTWTGQPIDFLGSIRNLGPTTTTAAFWVEFVGDPVDGPGASVLMCDSLLVPAGLGVGESVDLATLDRTAYGTARGVQPGRYHISVSADALNAIQERREGNNTLQAFGEFTLWASPNDLRPTVFNFSPDHVFGGESITLTGEIEYTGVEASTQAFWVEFVCSPNPDLSEPRYPLCDSLLVPEGLAPESTWPFSILRTVYYSPPGPPSGFYYVAVVVDPNDVVVEKDEANNTACDTARLVYINNATRARQWQIYR